jgi:hypothetical protein
MTYAVAVSTSGQDAVITLDAVSGKYYLIERIIYSYSNSIALGTGNFKITFDGDSILDFDVKNDILGSVLNLDNLGYQSGINQEVILKLKGVSGIIGKISIVYTEYFV